MLDGKTPALPLDSFFALNPAMPNLHRLYKAQQATIVHATATPYRERSHFDGQDVLESGIARPGAVDTGWLNRALVELASDGRVDLRGSRALGVGAVTPLVVRGRAPVMSWVPQKLLPASDDTQARLLDLYQHTDPKLAVALEARMRLAALAAGGIDGQARRRTASGAWHCARARLFRRSRRRGRALSRQAGRPARRRGGLCRVGYAHQRGRGRPVSSPICWARSTARWPRSRPTWARPGARPRSPSSPSSAAPRTSTAPTAPTTAPAPLRFSPAARCKGGRMIADWPGLKPAQLYEERDLKPTTDLRAVLKGLLRDHLRVEERALASTVFPDSTDIAPTAGLVG